MEELEAKVIAFLPNLAKALIILFVGLLFAKIAKKALKKFEVNVVKKTKTEIDDIIFPFAEKLIIYAIYASAIIQALKQLYVPSKYLVAITILVFGIIIVNLLDKVLDQVQHKVIKKTTSKLDDVVFPLFRRALKYSILIIVLLMSLQTLGIQVTAALAGMGIAGLAISLAAKDTLANIIAGIFIIVDQPFTVGDRIEIWNAPKGTSTWGDVIDIGLRSTKIRTTDNIVIVIPNAEIAKRDVINYTAISPKIRIRIPVGISYESDLKKAEEIMLKIAKETKGVLSKPEPKVIVKEFGESSIDLELRVWIENARERRNITSEISRRIKEEFDKHGIEIPYPKRHVIIEDKSKS